MSYQVLARKYRPQNFNDLVGQDFVRDTLKNAVKLNRISHAYLFCGPRGTGKTSTARIFAKAINCDHLKDANPCNSCDVCEEITNGNSIDIIEIDGASNRGIDEIRQIRESAKFLPTKCRYKVYIIDEVHMLTEPAFNALLKILEEPPRHILFILATTNQYRIPETIISRCQVYSFKKVATENMKELIAKILNKEGLSYDIDALSLIARNADGCIRDALSIVDQVVAYTNGILEYSVVYKLLGLTDRELVYKLLSSIIKGESEKIAKICKEIDEKGLEYSYIIEQLIIYVRYLINYAYTKELIERELVTEELELIKRLVPYSYSQRLFLIFQILLKVSNDIKLYAFDKYVFEIGLYKATISEELIPSDLRNGKFDGRDENPLTAYAAKSSGLIGNFNGRGENYRNIKRNDYTKSENKDVKSLSNNVKVSNETWREFLNRLGKNNPNISINLNYGHLDFSKEGVLNVVFTNDKKFHYQIVKSRNNFELIKREVYNYFNNIKEFNIFLSDEDSKDQGVKNNIEQVEEPETYKELKIKREIEEDKLVKTIINDFEASIKYIEVENKNKEKKK
ncbi:MAG: DNA polymerase III subunit gamma/tau [Deferribacterota bacterium]|nr:DNA polymerase III subunit gamma/tau [Deferribacterota bacterium]